MLKQLISYCKATILLVKSGINSHSLKIGVR